MMRFAEYMTRMDGIYRSPQSPLVDTDYDASMSADKSGDRKKATEIVFEVARQVFHSSSQEDRVMLGAIVLGLTFRDDFIDGRFNELPLIDFMDDEQFNEIAELTKNPDADRDDVIDMIANICGKKFIPTVNQKIKQYGCKVVTGGKYPLSLVALGSGNEAFYQPRSARPGHDDPSMELPQSGTSIPVAKVSVPWSDVVNTTSKCPVYIDQQPDGSYVYSAYISGPIGDVTEYTDLIDTLFSAGPDDTYYLMIDSPGGAISAGSIISSAIWACQAKVITLARGLCASAAALIHCAVKPGNSRLCPLGMLMIHMSSHTDAGVSTFIAKRAEDQVRYVNENLLRPALEQGYITQEELAQIQNGEEIYITAEEFNSRVGAVPGEQQHG